MKRIMYIEDKGDGLEGPGRIGWVEITRTGRSYKYKGKLYKRCAGYKYNCIEEETGRNFWISGPKKNGQDRLYGGIVEIYSSHLNFSVFKRLERENFRSAVFAIPAS
ncbi:MAG: hypothetical protein JW806_10630, partial [Sedimentisphaerales bacterium]|nr:hypothetical protein [Sedimentisphaerales bacterium]